MNSFERKPSGNDVIALSCERLRLTVSPSIGGSISGFHWIGDDRAWLILRECHSPLEKVLDAASFPLVPYVNRIRGGRFSFRNREVSIQPNMAGDPSPLHGQGWLGAWQVESHSETQAVVSFSHRAGEWPWDYEALQEFSLDARGLSVTLTCHNRDSEPMPCGLGQHPYFPCGPETRLDTQVTHVWTVDEHVLPVDRIQATGHYDLSERHICGQDLDNGFAGWGGEVLITDPGWRFELRMSSPDAPFFQVYSPTDGGIFVAEPVTQANAALNQPEDTWPALGLKVLEPGGSMSLAMRIEVVAK